MREFENRVAVITGGASGIGYGMAERFAASGMKLVLADVEAASLRDAVGKLEARGAEVLGVETDVSDADQMDALAARTFERFGTAHVVCNNAGVGGGGTMWELTTRDWEWVLGVNLWGVIHGVRVFGKQLVEQDEGHFVNTASMAGMVSVPNMGPYNVTKHGVVTLSETLLGELQAAGSKVGVSVLCPGFVNTRIFDSERNRPDALRNGEADSPDPERREMMRKFMESNGMSTADVAERVFDAVHEQRLYILTHEGSENGIRRRMDAIIEGRNPEPISPGVFSQE